jgi:putative spermidine/putrescine transport system permease protein
MLTSKAIRSQGASRPGAGRRTFVNTMLAAPITTLMVIGYVLPSLLMLSISLGGAIGSWPFAATLSFGKYLEVFSSSYTWRVLVFTLIVSVAVAVVNALLAYPMALYLARSRSKWTGTVFLIAFTPLAVGMNMMTMGWLIMLGKNGVINYALQALGLTSGPVPLVYGLIAVVIGLAHISFTFMLLPIESVLRSIDPAVERASRSLGAPPWRTFLTITLPLSFEGVAAGMLIVFMQSCGAFVIPLLLGGSSTVMLPVAIWEQMTVANDRAAGAALATVLAVIALFILAIQLRYFNPRRSTP